MLHSNIPLTEPSRVTYVSVTKSVEGRNLTLTVSWTTPQSELPITEYEVEYNTSVTAWMRVTLSGSPLATSTFLTSLDTQAGYSVRVRALSEIGAGVWSEEQRVRADDGEFLQSMHSSNEC